MQGVRQEEPELLRHRQCGWLRSERCSGFYTAVTTTDRYWRLNRPLTCLATSDEQSGDTSSGFESGTASFVLQTTHRVIYRFVPRHPDELALEIVTPPSRHSLPSLQTTRFCLGMNLRSNEAGIFPAAHVFEIDLSESFDIPRDLGTLMMNEKATFGLTYLGSLEVTHHKGNDVLVQAINKVLDMYQNKEDTLVPMKVLLDISYRGIHLIDKSSKNVNIFISQLFCTTARSTPRVYPP
ncbi:unnamed protein product [Soboliphyme baturini]|uniref:PID domain-containing protein n=1 Tax=Soboliphyme baturini TaxID=241478 RepID=A0A3P8C5Q7_9BILA|nr:unnamed protein product [Soboliphyme baturini]